MAKWLIPNEDKMNEVAETKHAKVNAMLAMRKLVKDHITGKNGGNVKHLGELQLDNEENTRLVISLQDFADRVLGKLKRATGHLANASETIDYLVRTAREQQQTIEQMGYRQEALIRRNKNLEESNRNQGEELERARRQLAVFKELFVEHEQNHKNEKVPVSADFGEMVSADVPNPMFMAARRGGKSKTLRDMLEGYNTVSLGRSLFK